MIHNDQQLLDAIWYNFLGVIKTKDTITNETKFYIGLGLGISEEEDIKHIIDYGTKYTPESFRQLIKWLEG